MKREPTAQSKFMSPKQAAEQFEVHVNTVLAWIKNGKIEALQPAGPGGRLFIPK